MTLHNVTLKGNVALKRKVEAVINKHLHASTFEAGKNG